MNAIDQYRDSSLDGLVENRRNTEGHGRRVVSEGYGRFDPTSLPPEAPEPPAGPPIAFRGAGLGGAGHMQRSFSQRARNRPYADEAFADYDEDLNNVYAKAEMARRAFKPTTNDYEPSTPPQPEQPRGTAQELMDRQRQLIRDNIQSAANAANPQPLQQSRASQHRSDPLPARVPEKLSIPQQSSMPVASSPTAIRNGSKPADGSSRDWAQDRSPLQKLEVTLNDISKEEKRARVQEAEMILMEKNRKQKAAQSSASRNRDMQNTVKSAAHAVAAPATLEDAGLVRNLSNTQRDRLQHSTTIESRRPDARRLSGERGFEYAQSNVPMHQSVTIGRSSSGQKPKIAQPQTFSAQQMPFVGGSQEISPGARRSLMASQQGQMLPQQRNVPPRSRDDNAASTASERNSSHRAALGRLTGVNAAANTSPSLTQTRSVDSAPMANNRTSTPQDQQIPVGLGLQNSPMAPSVDSPALPDGRAHRARKSSVSFKEQFDRRRPVDEWKSAKTARLLDDHFKRDATVQEVQDDQYKPWWEQDNKSRRRSSTNKYAMATPIKNATIDDKSAQFNPRLFLKCGPLLRYTGLKRTSGQGAKEYWRGSVMIVTNDSLSSYEDSPTLRLFSQPKELLTSPPPVIQDGQLAPEHIDPIAGSTKVSRIGRALYVRPVDHLEEGRDLSAIETDDGLFETSPSPLDGADGQTMVLPPHHERLSGETGETFGRFEEVKGVRLYADPDRDVTFWLFKLEVELGDTDRHIGYRINHGASTGFWVPARGKTMNIMFHSCNGFSKSVNPDEFSGPDPLWRDVLNSHQSRPFHVMIGGGDQLYNDRAADDCPSLKSWTTNKNPHYKHHAPFGTDMREELESFYLNHYAEWFSRGLFSVANAQIPMVNIWDDHDIIDGFGSYPDALMRSPVFSGIGSIAFKYYMLFQHQSVEGMTSSDEPSWVLGYKPGPYIKQQSRSIFLELGRPVAFLGLDCRTERTHSQVISYDSCDIALERCRKEIIEGQTRHLIVLLGVPIAYPRMNWLENILTSRAMDPVKAMGRYGVIKGGFLNKFDGGVEVLDDLDDHWTAKSHKEERNEFIKELQDLAAERSVRITILGGDVHLAAIGQFYSNPKLKIPKDRDHRYMPNVVSSAIVNTPPPELLADTLNKRNKVHHLDHYTDESMIPMFTHDTNMKKRNNRHLLPRRNWCSITAYVPGKTPPSSRETSPSRSGSDVMDEGEADLQPTKRRFSLTKEDVNPRALFRRLSSRNAPPTAYKQQEGSFPGQPVRSASFDGGNRDAAGQKFFGAPINAPHRSASETRNPTFDSETNFEQNQDSRGRPPFRPGFHRRPTNLSEKAAKKGNVPAIDAEGNEFDVNDHVNLEGGLDIVLNCEVDQKDPSGITEPYRLLVPALWYDGSSDREKLDESQGVQRNPSLLNRMGFGSRNNKGTGKQGVGNWGQDMSETESYSGTEDEAQEAQPKKKFGFLGSFKKKRFEEPQFDEVSRSDGMIAGSKEQVQPLGDVPQMGFRAAPGGQDMSYGNSPTTGPQLKPSALSKSTPMNAPQNSPLGSAQPVSMPPQDRDVPHKTNRQRSGSIDAPEPLFGQHSATYQPLARQTRPVQTVDYPAPVLPGISKRNSYTIGAPPGVAASRSVSGTSTASRPFDADSAYMRQQQHQQAPPTGRNVQPQHRPLTSHNQFVTRLTATPPTSFPAQTFSPPPTIPTNQELARTTSRRNNGLSKQEQILGIATSHDTFSGNPQQSSLRGNGLIGKDPQRNTLASARPGTGYAANSAVSFGSDGIPQNSFPAADQRGYSGIDAYRDPEKPKRRFSLRDKARGMMDKLEGRNKYYGDYDYSKDDEHHDGPYSDEGSEFEEEGAYSDEEMENEKRGGGNFFSGLSRRLSNRRTSGRQQPPPLQEQPQQRQQY